MKHMKIDINIKENGTKIQKEIIFNVKLKFLMKELNGKRYF